MVSGIAEAPPAGLGKLLMESRFIVPNHQRDYSWTEQVKQLFDDIDSAIEGLLGDQSWAKPPCNLASL
jgi:hypothetical protein